MRTECEERRKNGRDVYIFREEIVHRKDILEIMKKEIEKSKFEKSETENSPPPTGQK